MAIASFKDEQFLTLARIMFCLIDVVLLSVKCCKFCRLKPNE